MLNWADVSLVISTLLCAAFAGAVACEGRAGWLVILFVIGGLVFAFCAGIIARACGYWLLFTGCRLQKFFFVLFFFAGYMAIPAAVVVGAVKTTMLLTERLTQQMF